MAVVETFVVSFDWVFVFLSPRPSARASAWVSAAARLYTKMEYEAHDFFPADIYYQNSCYIKFALKEIEQTVDENVELIQSDDLSFFGAK